MRAILVFLVGPAAAAAGGLAVLFAASPNVAPLTEVDPATTAFIERTQKMGLEVEWIPVPYDAIAEDLKLAIVVAEDIRFFSHNGFDRIEIRAAVGDAVRGNRLRGASTLTQQLARNLWLSNRRSPIRKLREAFLTVKLEHRLSKRRILHLYLNILSSPFYNQIYGFFLPGLRVEIKFIYDGLKA